jgi:hypothetical protein
MKSILIASMQGSLYAFTSVENMLRKEGLTVDNVVKVYLSGKPSSLEALNSALCAGVQGYKFIIQTDDEHIILKGMISHIL